MNEDIMDRFFRVDDDDEIVDPTKDKANWDASFDDMDSGDWEEYFGTNEDPRDGEPREEE